MPTIGDRFVEWAHTKPEICLVALIGSRARSTSTPLGADEYSDWDFHVATTDVAAFAESNWLKELKLDPLTYVERGGRLGDTRKVTAIFDEGEIDWVVLPASQFRGLVAPVMNSLHNASSPTREAIAHLAAVLEGGYRILKGADEFAEFYRSAAALAIRSRLSTEALKTLADGFVCDYVSTLRKIQRGEYLAARRWLHVNLMETVFKLLHESRLRTGLPTMPDARKLEFTGEPRLAELTGEITLTGQSVGDAVERSAQALRRLMSELTADEWRWPDLSRLRLRAK
jgi:hypothetical protein